ncbi:MAG: serpin family protein [Bacteroidales bacterium]|jgi:serpin B|nr:serpin family protein [Bacteroidales bacterium]
MKKYVNLIVILAALMMVSCSNDETNNESNQPTGKVNTTLVEQGNCFAMKLFATANAQSPNEENLILSPLSLNMALAMVWNGANGQTKAAILQAMGMSDFDPEYVNSHFQTMRQNLETADPNTQLALANSIWYRLGFPVKQSFIDLNTTYYDALVQGLDFDNPSAVDIINQWCSDNTNGLIPHMIDPPISAETMMYLINALYFKSLWADSCGFDPELTYQTNFTKGNNQQVDVQMMHQKNYLKYYSDDNLAMVTIPYGNNSFSMTFILPASNSSFVAMLNALQQNGYWQNCMNGRVKQMVNVDVPKFKLRYDSEETLVPILTSLGMGIAFGDAADFSGIADASLCISNVKQKTYIDVNETGTEAAAVTVITIGVTSAGNGTPQFFANRPFLFVIQEESTGSVLFMGKIGHPQYEE